MTGHLHRGANCPLNEAQQRDWDKFAKLQARQAPDLWGGELGVVVDVFLWWLGAKKVSAQGM